MGGNRTTTFRPKKKLVPHLTLNSGHSAYVIPAVIDVTVSQHAEVNEDYLISERQAKKDECEEGGSQNLGKLSADVPMEKIENYYHLTPVGTPSSSSASSTPPPPNVSLSTSTMDDLFREIEFFNQVAQELDAAEENCPDSVPRNESH